MSSSPEEPPFGRIPHPQPPPHPWAEPLMSQLYFSPMPLSLLEKYLWPQMLSLPRDSKVNYMRDILLRYSPQGDRSRVLKHREYRQRILANYKPIHRELYSMHPPSFFVPTFLEAVKDNTAESIKSVENFRRWVHYSNFRIMRPNTMNKYGAVLNDFGMDGMFGEMIDDFIRPIAKVLFPEVGGSTLASHHGFVVKYGMDRGVELGILDYCHVPGYAVLHGGRHRLGARATTLGRRVNLILWCRSSVFEEMKKHPFSCWCGEGQRTKRARHKLSVATTKLEVMKRNRKVAS